MSYRPSEDAARCAVVDLGSNSVRLVVYQGYTRNPAVIFNEKAILRLGLGLEATGRLSDAGMDRTLTVMQRYYAVARSMGAEPLEVLATAAVREAVNGPEFVRRLEQLMPGVPIHILSGESEAALSADGVLFGIPKADGILADIGGGSLELASLENGRRGAAYTLKLGAIRLAERSGQDLLKARAIADDDLATVPWLAKRAGLDLYLVGGAFRALARIHIAQTGYPLKMVHHYTVGREEVRDLTGLLINSTRRTLERLPGIPRRRVEDLPFAAMALRRILRWTTPRRVIFSANGLREGWFMRRLPEAVRTEDPLITAGHEFAARLARHPGLPPALLTWTDPLFAGDNVEERRLREAACWMSDVGSHDHPEFRAEQSFFRVLRQPGIGLDHHTRAFLAVTIASRYEARLDASFLPLALPLLDKESAKRAEAIGTALRLAYTLSGGTPDVLAGAKLEIREGKLRLHLAEGSGVFAGDSVTRRLERLAAALELDPQVEVFCR